MENETPVKIPQNSQAARAFKIYKDAPDEIIASGVAFFKAIESVGEPKKLKVIRNLPQRGSRVELYYPDHTFVWITWDLDGVEMKTGMWRDNVPLN